MSRLCPAHTTSCCSGPRAAAGLGPPHLQRESLSQEHYQPTSGLKPWAPTARVLSSQQGLPESQDAPAEADARRLLPGQSPGLRPSPETLNHAKEEARAAFRSGHLTRPARRRIIPSEWGVAPGQPRHGPGLAPAEGEARHTGRTGHCPGGCCSERPVVLHPCLGPPWWARWVCVSRGELIGQWRR